MVNEDKLGKIDKNERVLRTTSEEDMKIIREYIKRNKEKIPFIDLQINKNN